MKLDSLFIYPIKGCRAQSVRSLRILEDGPEGDRLWMLVDDEGRFISQRSHPKLATLEAHLDEQALTFGFQKQFFRIPRNQSSSRTVTVTIWNESVDAVLEADLYSQAISQYLGLSCRLVRYSTHSKRKVGQKQDDKWSPEVRFADGRPLLLLNKKSLEDLNARLISPVGVDRFRGNLVIAGEKAFEEDLWRRIKIGEVIFSQPKLCARCAVINIDQSTGVAPNTEVLKTLAGYRRSEGKVNFGSLWIPENRGLVQLSDSLEVLE